MPNSTAARRASGSSVAHDPRVVAQAIRNFQNGSRREESFRVLFDIYHRPVQAFFSKRLRRADDSLDLTQETLARVYRGLEGYRGDAPFGAWVFRIAWNVLHRQRATTSASAVRRHQVPIDDMTKRGEMATVEAATVDGTDRSALAQVLAGEQRQILRDAIAELPQQRRRCITLWAYHELTYEQIARVMHLSIGTIKAHLAQARKQLEIVLKDEHGARQP